MLIYLNTFNNGGYTYEDFVEYVKDENWDMSEDELDIPSEDSEEYHEWLHTVVEDDIDCFFTNLKYSMGVVHDPCVITGTLGLWDGRHTIFPTECNELAEAIRKCCENCNEFQVSIEDGVVYVEASHHDGVNKFEIRLKDGSDYPKRLY